MWPSLIRTSLFSLAFLVALALFGPYGALPVWVIFFCVSLVQRKPQPVVEGRDNETKTEGERKRKRKMRSTTPRARQSAAQLLSQAADLLFKFQVLFVVLCQVVLFARCNTVPLLPPSPARATATNDPNQEEKKNTKYSA